MNTWMNDVHIQCHFWMYVGSRDRLSELEGYWVIYKSNRTHQEMSPASQYLLATALQGPRAKTWACLDPMIITFPAFIQGYLYVRALEFWSWLSSRSTQSLHNKQQHVFRSLLAIYLDVSSTWQPAPPPFFDRNQGNIKSYWFWF